MKKKVAVIIPAFNEEQTIGDVIRRCFAALQESKYEPVVIVVDDGSTDRTGEEVLAAKAKIVKHTRNQGVGKAFQTGLKTAIQERVDFIVNIDADGQFNPEDIPKLLEPLLEDRADFVTASRFKDTALIPEMPLSKKVGNYWMSVFISKIARQKLHDVSCGFRAYTVDTALQLNLWGSFTYTQESILDLAVKGIRLTEVPLKIQGVRSHGESKVASNLWRYGYRTFNIIIQSFRDYWPLRFFGLISLPFFTVGFLLAVFFIGHRISTGKFSPHLWSGFTSAAAFIIGLLILITGLLAEMLKRIRLNQEMLIYYHKKQVLCPPEKSDENE